MTNHAEGPGTDPVSDLITAAASGDGESAEKLVPIVYDELRALAARLMAQEPRDHTLQPTALVHEAYLRLVGSKQLRWQDRFHFYSTAARAMRRILIDRARRHEQKKRGGERDRVSLDSRIIAVDREAGELVALESCLEELEAHNERWAQTVMLRYFAGLTVEETAQALDVSTRTVKREWRFARAWIYDRMDEIRGET